MRAEIRVRKDGCRDLAVTRLPHGAIIAELMDQANFLAIPGAFLCADVAYAWASVVTESGAVEIGFKETELDNMEALAKAVIAAAKKARRLAAKRDATL